MLYFPKFVDIFTSLVFVRIHRRSATTIIRQFDMLSVVLFQLLQSIQLVLVSTIRINLIPYRTFFKTLRFEVGSTLKHDFHRTKCEGILKFTMKNVRIIKAMQYKKPYFPQTVAMACHVEIGVVL